MDSEPGAGLHLSALLLYVKKKSQFSTLQALVSDSIVITNMPMLISLEKGVMFWWHVCLHLYKSALEHCGCLQSVGFRLFTAFADLSCPLDWPNLVSFHRQ